MSLEQLTSKGRQTLIERLSFAKRLGRTSMRYIYREASAILCTKVGSRSALAGLNNIIKEQFCRARGF